MKDALIRPLRSRQEVLDGILQRRAEVIQIIAAIRDRATCNDPAAQALLRHYEQELERAEQLARILGTAAHPRLFDE